MGPQVVMQTQPVMIQRPRVIMQQQPQMVMQQQPQMMQPRVIERTIVTPKTQIIRTTIKPVRKQIGTKIVATVQNVETQNPATMMTTEYAEPYVKRDGYTQVTGYGQQSTKVIRRGKTMLLVESPPHACNPSLPP